MLPLPRGLQCSPQEERGMLAHVSKCETGACSVVRGQIRLPSSSHLCSCGKKRMHLYLCLSRLNVSGNFPSGNPSCLTNFYIEDAFTDYLILIATLEYEFFFLPNLQMRKLRLREMVWLAKGHTSRQQIKVQKQGVGQAGCGPGRLALALALLEYSATSSTVKVQM